MQVQRSRKDQAIFTLQKMDQKATASWRLVLQRDIDSVVTSMVDIMQSFDRAIVSLPPNDPRKIGKRRQYNDLCAQTAVLMGVVKAFKRDQLYNGVKIDPKTMIEMLETWAVDLNKWLNPQEKSPIPWHMRGLMLRIVVCKDTDARYETWVSVQAILTEAASG